VAANPSGEEKSPAPSRGLSPARIAAIGGLIVVAIALGVVLFGGGGEYHYDLLFQNAGQLVPENQVLIGGSQVGSVESIELTENNLASVKVGVSQQLHQGTTAVIRATSLSGVANHYVSISPGPNSNPSLEEGATLGLASTTTPVDIDQLFNTFPPSVRRGLSEFIRGNAAIYAGVGHQANQAYKYFGPALNRTDAFVHALNADQNLFTRFIVSSSKLATAVSERNNQLSSAISNASTAFGAIAGQNVSLDQALQEFPAVLRQSNTTFVNLRAAIGDLEPLVDTAKPATKDLAPFLAELRPVVNEAVPVFKDLRLTVSKPGKANDAAELLAALPDVQQSAAKAFPHSQEAIAAFQPTLDFARPYTPDIFNGFGKLGIASGYYDGNGNYVRGQIADLNLFNYNSGSGELEPITPKQQFEAFGSSAGIHRRCPGGATQSAPDNSNPFVDPPWAGAGVTPSECKPSDEPPGP
jgi:phospholipid/cholesterol/gamma-HCH transport system substrate-binding protein